MVVSSEDHRANTYRRLAYWTYKVHGRKQVLRKKAWKETGFKRWRNRFGQLCCEYGPMMIEQRNKHSG